MADFVSDHFSWINGQPHRPASPEIFEDANPLDDQAFARVVRGTPADIGLAVEAAAEAFHQHWQIGPSDREGWLLTAADLLQQRQQEFVDLLIDEVGSPITKARREIDTSVLQLRAAAGIPRRLAGKTLPTDVAGRVSLSVRRPLGVIAGITPFNVPLIKGVKHSAFPLATGNSVVLLPSPDAPLIALHLAKLYQEAGVPAGLINVVTGFGQEIGDALTGDPRVRMVTFTGSTVTGRHIAERCGRLGKRVTLEMGGRNPLVVLRDADLQLAVQNAVIGAFLFQGQICMSSSRLIVEQAVADDFLRALTARAETLGHGDLREPATMIGPIINQRQRQRIRRHLEDAVARGARVVTGNVWQGNRLLPTILTEVPDEAVLQREETFGPVTTVSVVADAQAALKAANATCFGLSASVFTQDLSQALTFAESLEAGMVHVNAGTIQEEAHVPFGGVGDSGFGREGTDAAIEEMTQWKWITMQTSQM
ncbi:MAG: aldehyde dehydrogenase family protein [Planctomycetaceae bacterium]|nr:aldehyde dehydrogenase family protein [Planctomycetaceae bacterium]